MPKHVMITINGTKYNSIAEAAKAFGVKYDTVYKRLRKGRSINRALKTPTQKHKSCWDSFGQSFGKLQVMDFIGRDERGDVICLCRCSCTNLTLLEVRLRSLRSGATKSCGCENQKVARSRRGKKHHSYTHGKTYSKIYGVWANIKNRAKKNNLALEKGWSDFVNFERDAIAAGYDDHNRSPHRIVPELGYIANNIEWISVDEHKARHRDFKFTRGMGSAKGKRSPNAKLTDTKVANICAEYESGVSQPSLAKKYNIGRNVITQVVNGHTYKDLTA